VPIEPKLLSFPFDTEQSFEYNQRRGPALEETYAYALHTEIDVGVPIDLVDTKLYEPPAVQAPMHELDRFITNPLFGTVQPKKAPGAALPRRCTCVAVLRSSRLPLLSLAVHPCLLLSVPVHPRPVPRPRPLPRPRFSRCRRRCRCAPLHAFHQCWI
jgi:hypothetical protein